LKLDVCRRLWKVELSKKKKRLFTKKKKNSTERKKKKDGEQVLSEGKEPNTRNLHSGQ